MTKLDAFAVGQLLAIYEHRTIVQVRRESLLGLRYGTRTDILATPELLGIHFRGELLRSILPRLRERAGTPRPSPAQRIPPPGGERPRLQQFVRLLTRGVSFTRKE